MFDTGFAGVFSGNLNLNNGKANAGNLIGGNTGGNVNITPYQMDLVAPQLALVKLDEQTVQTSWNPVAGATGYLLWRGNFSIDVGNVLAFVTGSLPAGVYTWTVQAYDSSSPRNLSPMSNQIQAALGGSNTNPTPAPVTATAPPATGTYYQLPPQYNLTPYQSVNENHVDQFGNIVDQYGNIVTPASQVPVAAPVTNGIMDFVMNHYLIVGAVLGIGYFSLKSNR